MPTSPSSPPPRYLEAGRYARLHREQKQVTINDVASAVGVSIGTILRWEKAGIPGNLTRHEQRSWERVLGVPHGTLLSPPPARADKTIGLRACERREEIGESRVRIAVRLGLSTSALRVWESRTPDDAFTQEQIRSWEHALKMPPGSLGKALPDKAPEHPTQDASLSWTIRHIIDTTAARAIKSLAGLTDKAYARRAAMFARRYGVDVPEPMTLAEIAREFSVTESRICQVLRPITPERFAKKADARFFLELAEAAAPHLPCPVSRLDALLRPRLGDGVSLCGAMSFARDAFGLELLAVTKVEDIAGFEFVAHAPNSPVTVAGKHSALRSLANGMIRACGAAHIGLIRLNAIEQQWSESEIAAIPQVLASISGFQWLEVADRRAAQWFWFGHENPSTNPVVSAARRIMATADQAIPIDTIVTGIARVRAFRQYRHELGHLLDVDPPVSVVESLLRRLSFLEWEGSTPSRCKAGLSLSVKNDLWEHEAMLLVAIQAFGNVARRRDLLEFIAPSEKDTRLAAALAMTLHSSPLFTRVCPGVYRLVAREPSHDAMVRAIENARGT
jgi:transcriptional regulator with XRE-family HTH domain